MIFFADIVVQTPFVKKANRIFIFFIILHSTASLAQSEMPPYPEVVKKFYTSYTYEPKDEYQELRFAKKAKGWFIQLVDRVHDDSIMNEQRFWGENKFLPLIGFDEGQSDNASKIIGDVIRGDGGPNAYGYERCRYFGYDNWDVDMIKDFGNNIPANDTLLEGLARAYAFYAERYIDYSPGGKPYDDDPLKMKLGKLEPRSPDRIKQFIFYVDKGIDCYRVLQKRNPGYVMIVGTPEMKLLNEQFHKYQQLLTYGYTKEAQDVLATVPNSDLYSKMGRTYLNACPPNSILITYGDNDTYPLWYVQTKEGFRKDVIVLNNSLLGTIPYVNMIKKNNPLILSITPGFLKRLQREYFYFMEDSTQVVDITTPLPTFIDELKAFKYPHFSSDTLTTYRVKNVVFEVNLAKIKKICNQTNLAPLMSF